MPDVHLGLHNLEIVRLIGLDFTSHSFAGPLPETVEFAVHDGSCWVFTTGGRIVACSVLNKL